MRGALLRQAAVAIEHLEAQLALQRGSGDVSLLNACHTSMALVAKLTSRHFDLMALPSP